jgi:thiamine phosphate synthase YjbQ (UPF0047 family)
VKSYRKELWFETPGRRAFLNITPQVEAALKESGVGEGLALVNAMHITASVFINDDEKGLHADYDAWLERLAPHEPAGRVGLHPLESAALSRSTRRPDIRQRLATAD